MNLRDLHYFTTLATTLHFSQAADACHVSQPTLSAQIKKLEDTLGVTLFERSGKTVLLTDAGKQLLPHAQKIMLESKLLRDHAKTLSDPMAGDLKLACIPTLAPYLLPRAMPLAQKALPNIRFLLYELQTEQCLSQLQSGDIDAAILAELPGMDAFKSFTLFDEPFYVTLPPSDPLAKKKSLHLSDIADRKLLLLEEGHCLRQQALEACQLPATRKGEGYKATSLETLRQMVASGAGITLMPRLAVREDDGTVTKPFAAPAPSRHIIMLARPNSPRIPALTALARQISLL